MNKKIHYSVKVIGDENESKVVYSKNMTNIELMALTKELVKQCYSMELPHVPQKTVVEITDRFIEDAKKEALKK